MVVATPVAGSDQTSVTEEKLKQDRRVALQKADDYGRFAEQARRENRQLAERESTWKKRHSGKVPVLPCHAPCSTSLTYTPSRPCPFCAMT